MRPKASSWKHLVASFFGLGSPQDDEISIYNFSFDEKVIYFTAVLTPVWWLLGIQPLFYPAVGLLLLVKNFDYHQAIRRPLPFSIWAWFIMSLVMLISVLVGLNEVGADLMTVLAAMVTVYKSYIMIFAFLAVPFWGKVRSQVVTRAITWMAFGFLVNLLIQLIVLAGGGSRLVFVPPLAQIIPGDVKSLLVKGAKISQFFGVPLPRSLLHTVDPPILGAVSFLALMISLTDRKLEMRRWGIAGSIAALIISFSRSAWVGTILGMLILSSFRIPAFRTTYLLMGSGLFWLCSLVERTVFQLMALPMEIFNQARAASSNTRSLVVKETLEAWLDKFWLGWGIIRGEVWLYETKFISLGSFSTYAAVLYLHGIIGFITFIVSLISTLWAVILPAVKGEFKSQVATACLIVLYILIQATPLSWMAIYLWFFFVWLGCILHETRVFYYKK